MGLDTSHDCWHGSYGRFNSWRLAIAEALGWQIDEVEYGRRRYTIPPDLLPDGFVAGRLGFFDEHMVTGEWGDITPEHPIIVLMGHSDCDGRIPARLTGPLAMALREIKDELPEEWHEMTQQFINGLARAADYGEDVSFG